VKQPGIAKLSKTDTPGMPGDRRPLARKKPNDIKKTNKTDAGMSKQITKGAGSRPGGL